MERVVNISSLLTNSCHHSNLLRLQVRIIHSYHLPLVRPPFCYECAEGEHVPVEFNKLSH